MSSESPYHLRSYKESDFEAVCELFKLNSPYYFAPKEFAELQDYLQHKKEDYFVIEINNSLIACGGINYFPDEHIARLSWDIVHPEFQGAGFGTLLVKHRMNLLKDNSNIKSIVVRTSQLTSKFYEKKGFQLVQTKDHFWADNFHLHQLEKLN